MGKNKAMGSWVDPQLRPLLAVLPALGALSAETLESIRASLGTGEIAAGNESISIERVMLTAENRSRNPIAVSAVLYRPRSAKNLRPAVLNIHGGGYVAGSVARDDAAMRELAVALDCVVMSVDYRLAPETPYPGPLEDCYTALAWLDTQAERLDIDRTRIAVRGVSAGGGLATGLALLARDRGGPCPMFVALLYPMLDHRTKASPGLGEHVWSAEANRFGWDSYLCGLSVVGGYASPAIMESLEGFPPCFLAVGSIDLFVGEDLAFAARLAQSGVPVELRLYAGAYHGFNLASDSDAARSYKTDELKALQRAFGGVFAA